MGVEVSDLSPSPGTTGGSKLGSNEAGGVPEREDVFSYIQLPHQIIQSRGKALGRDGGEGVTLTLEYFKSFMLYQHFASSD